MPPPQTQEEDGFVDVQHEDVEMQDSGSNAEELPPKASVDSLDLHRISHSDKGEEEDDSEDDRDMMANHPLLNMLTGRLGQRRRGSTHTWDRLHPENQALSVADVDHCSALEDEAFSVEERASREKFQYRLTRCPELSLGLFTQPTKAEAEASSKTTRRRLIGHVVSTMTCAPSLTEESMGVPPDTKTRESASKADGDEEPLGHQELGRTICVHSLAVAPEFQKMGLGSVLMKSYIQRMKDSKIADRIALLAHDHLVPFYKSLGFENMGSSAVTSHGGNWNNMILEFSQEEDD